MIDEGSGFQLGLWQLVLENQIRRAILEVSRYRSIEWSLGTVQWG